MKQRFFILKAFSLASYKNSYARPRITVVITTVGKYFWTDD